MPFSNQPRAIRGNSIFLARSCIWLRAWAVLLTARYVPNSSWSRVGHDPNAERILFHRRFPRQGVMPRIFIYPHILYPILKATRLHVRVCGVLCIRPSSKLRIFDTRFFARAVAFYCGGKGNETRIATVASRCSSPFCPKRMNCAMNSRGSTCWCWAFRSIRSRSTRSNWPNA